MAVINPAPGVVLDTDRMHVVSLCPGCGLEAMGVAVTEESVQDWFVAVIAGLCPEDSLDDVIRVASVHTANYMERPWHNDE